MANVSVKKFMPERKRRYAITPSTVKPDMAFSTEGRKGYFTHTAADNLNLMLKVHLDRLYKGRKKFMPNKFAAAVSKLADNRPMNDVDAYEWLLDHYLEHGEQWDFPGRDNAIKEMRKGFRRIRQDAEDRKIAAERRKALLAAQQIPGAEFYQSLAWRQLRYQVLKERGQTCEACRRSAAEHGVAIHVDHIFPRSEFPDLALEITNCQVLCDDCNIGKGTEDTTDWRSPTG